MISIPARVISSRSQFGCLTVISNLLIPNTPSCQADVKDSIALGCETAVVKLSRYIAVILGPVLQFLIEHV